MEALGIAPTQGVIDHHGDAPIIRAHDSGARDSAEDAKLLLSSGAELFYIQRRVLKRATYYPQFLVKLRRKGRTEHDSPELVDSLLERFDVAQVGLPAVLFKRFLQQACGLGALLYAGVLSFDVPPFAEGLVIEPLQTLFAVEIQASSKLTLAISVGLEFLNGPFLGRASVQKKSFERIRIRSLQLCLNVLPGTRERRPSALGSPQEQP